MKKIFLRTGIILAGISFVFLFSQTFAAESLKVGIVLPLTGEKAAFGEIEKNSFLMALDEINKAGGVRGTEITLLFEDDTGKPDAGPGRRRKAHFQG